MPWLLTFGLVLGWAGEAQAQDEIRLTVDKESIREDEGAQEITVTATHYAGGTLDAAKTKPSVATVVLLTTSTTGLNTRFTVTQAAITIPKDADNGVAKLTITPIPFDSEATEAADDTNNDVVITITGTTAGPGIDGTQTVTIVDAHSVSTDIKLSFEPSSISMEAGPTTITVTAELNHEKVTKKGLTFPLIVVGFGDGADNDLAAAPDITDDGDADEDSDSRTRYGLRYYWAGQYNNSQEEGAGVDDLYHRS